MSDIRLSQNPGIGGLNELTTIEETMVQNLAALDYSAGSIIYHNGIGFVVLPIGTDGQVLTVNDTATAVGWEASGSAPVTSVNTQTGAVVLDADDISDAATTNKFVTAAEKTILGNTSGTNSGDNATNSQYSGLASSKQDALSGTGFVKISGTTISYDNATYVTASSTDTLTNKRVTARITSITSHATPTINTDNCDAVSITALAEAITSMTTNLSGTPTNFQRLIFRIKDDGTARAITWGSSFVAMGVALPTTTTISKVTTVGFLYDTVISKWGCVASVTES